MPRGWTWRKGFLAIIKLAVVFGSIAYILDYAHTAFSNQIDRGSLTNENWLLVGLAALLFAATTWFSIVGWRWVLARMSYDVPLARVAAVFTITQIAKYLPGNIGHHLGRVALARSSLGTPFSSAMLSLVQEGALVAMTAATVGLAIYAIVPAPRLGWGALQLDVRLLAGAIVLGGVLTCVFAHGLRPKLRTSQLDWARRILSIVPDLGTAIGAIVRYVPIYLLNGLAVSVIASDYLPLRALDVATLTAAFSLSWLVGFVLPGAPGGLGVREAAFLLLLDGTYPPSVSLMVILLARLASIVADLLVFCIGLATKHRLA